MTLQYRSLVGLVGVSSVVTGVGVWIAYQFELLLLGVTTVATWTLLVGLVEEAFVRFVPLILVFYGWSYWRGQLLSKTEGLLATVASGLTVALLELVLKLEYLSRLEATVQFDSLVLPLVFVHLPFALLAGRFAYALGERIHGSDDIGFPSLSRRTLAALVLGYLALAFAHVGYNVLI
ncbi:hypothetical protein NDI54_18085 [Haloarcula sp. S1AR25-5A]|jgi:hypothetical protein|uniref:PrsW family intramembrane metalloprotease n=2 Tax=Haloarcula TaxID=2237 RepID=A0AAE4EZQ0_9EURY|nr:MULTISPECIES: hypothetical protein [Haloarculaceae]MDS0223255.1 hypothetical protein [Haloarcula terrestris]MDS0284417.1 hypothetical protein [Halomicroarcula sp. S3CR25-11]MDT3437529.1 hypothetical protein [Haloarcula sp. 1CSR25-25]